MERANHKKDRGDVEVRTVSIEAASRALGISRGLGYDLAARGEFPVPVIRLGQRRMVVAKTALERLLEGATAQPGESTK